MIQAEFSPAEARARIVLRPNASWSWRANVMLIYTLMTVSGAIALGFLSMGYWLVLPFTVLEMTVLTAALYWCVRRTHRQEVITLDRHEVCVEQGHRQPERRRTFNRAFAAFHVHPATHPWYEPRIGIRSHGQEQEIGQFLSPDEKEDLARELRRAIRSIDALPNQAIP